MTKIKLKMFIVIRGDISPMAALIAYGHATLGTYLHFKDDLITQEWQKTSFVKIVLKAKDKKQFDLIKSWGENRVFTESTLDNIETCIGFKPVYNPSKLFQELEKYII